MPLSGRCRLPRHATSDKRHRDSRLRARKKRETGSTFRLANESYTRATSRAQSPHTSLDSCRDSVVSSRVSESDSDGVLRRFAFALWSLVFGAAASSLDSSTFLVSSHLTRRHLTLATLLSRHPTLRRSRTVEANRRKRYCILTATQVTCSRPHCTLGSQAQVTDHVSCSTAL